MSHALRTRTPVLVALAAVCAAALAVDDLRHRWATPLAAQPVWSGEDRPLAGLTWTFARIKYEAWPEKREEYLRNYGMEPWAVDYPIAEQNLSRRVQSVTAIQVGEPVLITITDPLLWEHPWTYIVEPGTMRLTDEEVPILREYLLRGGTLTFDDFHGPLEWDNFTREMRRVFPDRPIVDLEPPHPIYNTFYRLDAYPQVPGLGSFLRGRMWEKGGYEAKLRAIEDDQGRAMVIINFNTDMGDGWEWSNVTAYPGYLKHTWDAYRMAINQIVYALTR